MMDQTNPSPATISGPTTSRSMTPAMRGARAMSFFSLGLGVAELLYAKRIANRIGLEDQAGLVRAFGAREIVAGLGARSVNPGPAMWSRVAGDVVDLGTLASGIRRNRSSANRGAWVAVAAVAGVTVLDLLVATQLAAETKPGNGVRRDYSDRSGFPKGAAAARGAAAAPMPADVERAATQLATGSPDVAVSEATRLAGNDAVGQANNAPPTPPASRPTPAV